ncbi:MAG TPA: class I SAM-dependent methyltransferase [Dehalococcoidia bacterium]|nr:class I SAM-dependent methyltransferase [Dehalococcoidia bacterium]
MTLKRFEALKPWIEGKRVLHIGCVQHNWQKSLTNSWIHAYIVKQSREAMGIDILEEGVRELAEGGYKVETADAENFDLNAEFDVIFAGELIEHLEDLGGFLDSCKRHMGAESKLIITTPNSFGIVYFITRLFGIRFVNPEHTCWFDEQTIGQLLNRHSLEVIERKFLPIYSTNLSRTQNAVLQVIESLFPKRFRATLFMVSQKQ